MSGNYSGWNDDKGGPMSMAPAASSGGGDSDSGGGGSGVMNTVLGVAVVFSLLIAGGMGWRLMTQEAEYKKEITALNEKNTKALDAVKAQLERAKASDIEDRAYAAALRADNAYIRRYGQPYSAQPPEASARQQQLYDLKVENTKLRTPRVPRPPETKPVNWPSPS